MQIEPNLVLIGFMGSGKTTIGRRCAHRMGFQFRDSDSVIELRYKLTIPEIFEQYGEAQFRSWESEVIHDLSRCSKMVIATGGGAVLDTNNVARLKRSGILLLLKSDPEEILARCALRNNRPLLAMADDPLERIQTLMSTRNPLYESAADIIVDTTGSMRDETVSKVLTEYNNYISEWRQRSFPMRK